MKLQLHESGMTSGVLKWVGGLGLVAVLSLSAEAGERVALWPEGKIPDFQPHQIGAMTDESGQKGFVADEHRMPYLEWMDPPAASNANGGVMILISGGSYTCCCDVDLIKDWNKRFTADGWQCVNLVYRTPRAKGLPIYQSAWEDGQRAVRLVRIEARKRQLDLTRVGAIGMSAGAHLTMMLATCSQTPAYPAVDEVDREPCHVDFAFPCAVPYGLSDAVGVPATRNGNAIDCKLTGEFKFDAKTPPMCFFHGGADVYSPSHTTMIYRELRKRKMPAEIHLFADSSHGGFWTRDWYETATGFLRKRNLDKKRGPAVEIETRFPEDVAGVAYEKQDIWPKGRIPDLSTNQCMPYLEWWVPSNLTTKAIQIVYSGGGYWDNHPEKWDGVPAVRRFLNAKGMAVVVLKYRTPNTDPQFAKHTRPWQDLQRCIRLVRQGAKARGLDPQRIGIMGSSAGGHLTLMGATSAKSRSYWNVDAVDKLPCNVQWAVAIYPAYALTDGADQPNKTGGNDDSARLVPEFAFDLDTCPVLFLHGDADGWAAMNSVKCWEQLRRMGIQGELHTLVDCGHCFMMKAEEGTGAYNWLNRIWSFLSHKKLNK